MEINMVSLRQGKDLLIQYLDEVQNVLAFTVDNIHIYFLNQKPDISYIKNAWAEIHPAFEDITGSIIIVDESILKQYGLHGQQLLLKYNLWNKLEKKVRELIENTRNYRPTNSSEIRDATLNMLQSATVLFSALAFIVPKAKAVDSYCNSLSTLLSNKAP